MNNKIAFYGIDGLSNYDDSDEWLERLFKEREADELQKTNFKKGKHTHAYREELLNSEIVRLRRAGWSLAKIAEQLGCSPSTVRNRLNKLRMMKLI